MTWPLSSVRARASGLQLLLSTGAGRAAGAVLLLLAGVTLAGLFLLWPYEGDDFAPALSQDTTRAEVVGMATGGCRLQAGPDCRRVTIELRGGPDSGSRHGLTLTNDAYTPDIDLGDQIRVQNTLTAGLDPDLVLELPEGGLGEDQYVFVEFERKLPLAALALAFAALVVIFGRHRGLLALIGLGASLLLVVRFVVPAILDGQAPLLVALVGAFAVMFVTIPLTHGAGLKSVAAMLGAAVALLLTALLAVLLVELTHITGLASEEATLLRSGSGGSLSPQGLVLAGMVIGALGVLDDVTVSQASTVVALRHAQPRLASP